MVTHIVFFKLADPSAANIAATRDKLLSMSGRIDHLRHLEVGVDVIRSERSYDIALVTKFDSLDDLQAYQVHPYHAGEVVPHMKSVSTSVVAVDYEGA
jgi:stress responsive alpha/beta barrel protein